MINQLLIRQSILDLQDIMLNETDQSLSKEKYADLLSQIIVDAIKSAEVVAGQTVTTAVQVVPATGTGTGTGVTTTNGVLI